MTRTLTEKVAPNKAIALSRGAVPALCIAIVVKALLLFALALNTRFVMDEFWQLGQAKYLSDGLYTTIWPAKAVGYAVFYKLAHLVGWDAVSILHIGRVQTVLMGYATVLMVYAIARTMGESRVRALVIVLVLLCFSTFVERIFRTRSEPLALFFATAALLAVMSDPNSRRQLLLGGVLSGLAFLSTQKSVYFNFALGLALVSEAVIVGRRYTDALRRSALLIGGWSIPVALYCVAFGGSNPAPIFDNLVFGPVEVATTGQAYYNGLRHFVVQTLIRNLPLYVACIGGLALSLPGYRALAQRRRIAAVFTAVITALVFMHNQPWPYVFIMSIPFLALWAVVPYDVLRVRRDLQMMVMLALAGVVAISFTKNIRYLAHDNATQLAIIESAERLLAPDHAYFDGIGMIPNRSDQPHIWLDAKGVHQALEGGSDSDLFRALAEAPPHLIVRSYRTEALEPILRPLLENSYVAVTPNLVLPGRRIPADAAVPFDVPLAGEYATYDRTGAPVRATLSIDGVPRKFPTRLAAGIHEIVGGGEMLFILPAGLTLGALNQPAAPRPLFENVYGF